MSIHGTTNVKVKEEKVKGEVVFLSGGIGSSVLSYVLAYKSKKPITLIHLTVGERENEAARYIAKDIQRKNKNVEYVEIDVGELKGLNTHFGIALACLTAFEYKYPFCERNEWYRVYLGFCYDKARELGTQKREKSLKGYSKAMVGAILQMPYQFQTKDVVVGYGLWSGTPLDKTVSCEENCGECIKCLERKVAFARHGIVE